MMPAKIRRPVQAITLILLCAGLITPGAASAAMADSRRGVPAVAGELGDPQKVEAFIDGTIEAQLRAYHIPGAVVSIVENGEMVFAKGYGLADTESAAPMAADITLVRPGSVSKLFTWTAVMQLAEQGKVDLHADVNTYLGDIRISDTFPQPITLAHLLTHTPGFENRNEGLFVRQAEQVMPLADYLKRYAPARIYPPGETVAYSNYGTALAGYIVERVSGMSFEEYVECNIFVPLGMAHSTFRRPLPPALLSDLARSYEYVDGYYLEQTDFVQPGPAGGLASTATDMARFMIAHLQDGRFEGARILAASTAQEMHRQHFTVDSRASGWAYGFHEAEWNGMHIIWHGGSSYFFHSSLVLIPSEQIGLFVAYNSPGGSVARQDLLQAFLDHYYPADEQPLPRPPADFDLRAGDYAGVYLETRQNRTGVERMMALMSAITVEPTGRGTLKTVGVGPSFPEREVAQWIEVEPRVFRKMEGEGTLYFFTDENGDVTSFIEKNDVQEVFMRQPWYATSSLHLPLVAFLVLLFLAITVAWPIRSIAGLDKTAGNQQPRHVAALAYWLAWWSCALSAFFLIVFFAMMTNPEISFHVPAALDTLLVAPPVIGVLALAVAAFTVLAWSRRWWQTRIRIIHTLVAVAGLVFVWWLDYWNLLLYRL